MQADLQNTGELTEQELREATHLLRTVRDMTSGESFAALSEHIRLLERLMTAKSANSERMEYTHLPENIQKIMRTWDKDGEGSISADELREAAQSMQQLKNVNKWLRMGTLALFGIIILLLGGMLAASWAAAELTKDMRPSSAGVMRTTNGEVVRVASAETRLDANGVMTVSSMEGICGNYTPPAEHEQATTDRRLQDDTGAPAAVATARARMPRPLSSSLGDQFFRQLDDVTLTSDQGAVVHLRVHGYMRVPTVGAKCGSVVYLETVKGSVMLDDTDISFDDGFDELDGLGFSLASGGIGRRLQSGSAATGFFNRLEENSDSWECSGIPLPARPTRMIAKVVTYEPCTAGEQGVDPRQRTKGRCKSVYGGTRPGVGPLPSNLRTITLSSTDRARSRMNASTVEASSGSLYMRKEEHFITSPDYILTVGTLPMHFGQEIVSITRKEDGSSYRFQASLEGGTPGVRHFCSNTPGSSEATRRLREWIEARRLQAETAPSETFCEDSDNGRTDAGGYSCTTLYPTHANLCGELDDNDFIANRYCCACGGGQQNTVRRGQISTVGDGPELEDAMFIEYIGLWMESGRAYRHWRMMPRADAESLFMDPTMGTSAGMLQWEYWDEPETFAPFRLLDQEGTITQWEDVVLAAANSDVEDYLGGRGFSISSATQPGCDGRSSGLRRRLQNGDVVTPPMASQFVDLSQQDSSFYQGIMSSSSSIASPEAAEAAQAALAYMTSTQNLLAVPSSCLGPPCGLTAALVAPMPASMQSRFQGSRAESICSVAQQYGNCLAVEMLTSECRTSALVQTMSLCDAGLVIDGEGGQLLVGADAVPSPTALQIASERTGLDDEGLATAAALPGAMSDLAGDLMGDAGAGLIANAVGGLSMSSLIDELSAGNALSLNTTAASALAAELITSASAGLMDLTAAANLAGNIIAQQSGTNLDAGAAATIVQQFISAAQSGQIGGATAGGLAGQLIAATTSGLSLNGLSPSELSGQLIQSTSVEGFSGAATVLSNLFNTAGGDSSVLNLESLMSAATLTHSFINGSNAEGLAGTLIAAAGSGLIPTDLTSGAAGQLISFASSGNLAGAASVLAGAAEGHLPGFLTPVLGEGMAQQMIMAAMTGQVDPSTAGGMAGAAVAAASGGLMTADTAADFTGALISGGMSGGLSGAVQVLQSQAMTMIGRTSADRLTGVVENLVGIDIDAAGTLADYVSTASGVTTALRAGDLGGVVSGLTALNMTVAGLNVGELATVADGVLSGDIDGIFGAVDLVANYFNYTPSHHWEFISGDMMLNASFSLDALHFDSRGSFQIGPLSASANGGLHVVRDESDINIEGRIHITAAGNLFGLANLTAMINIEGERTEEGEMTFLVDGEFSVSAFGLLQGNVHSGYDQENMRFFATVDAEYRMCPWWPCGWNSAGPWDVIA